MDVQTHKVDIKAVMEENAQLKSRVDCLEKEMKTLKQQLSQQTNFFAALQITIFILATSFAILAMTHNSLYGIAIRFWGISHSFWSSLWNYIQVDLFQGDNFKLFAIGSMVLHLLVFWVGNGLFLLVDLTGKPEVLKKFKVQPGQNEPIDPMKFRRALIRVLFNQFVLTPIFSLIMFPLYQMRGDGMFAEVPSFQKVVIDLIVFVLAEEFFFYYSHRLFHTPWLYKRFHKIHHEWTAPIGIICIYAHPLEHILSNLFPVFVGPLLMNSHIMTTWLWTSIAVLTTTVSHSGYHFPLLPSPEAHDFHHLKFNTNYGVLGILDRLHGTDDLFRKSIAYSRHILFWSLTPLTESFPDPKQSKKVE